MALAICNFMAAIWGSLFEDACWKRLKDIGGKHYLPKWKETAWNKLKSQNAFVLVKEMGRKNYDLWLICRVGYESPCHARAAEPELPSQKIQNIFF